MERSGTEMEERSRECIFQCSVALFYISVTRRGAEQRWKKGPGNVFSKVWLPNSTSASHGTERTRDGRKVALLPYSTPSLPPSLSPFRSVPFRSVFPGNIEIIFYFLSLPPSLRSAPLRSVFPDKKWNGTEWNGMKWKRMDQNKQTIFSSVPFRCICS